ncbi:hypothetical protein [Neogemmobacter tilapiae]|uniref:Uncharacterized protein n=1 Tax=Neogemmobacter tilapiae TaxID=875041 RepID=A0A918TL89_9RHOB|nr:hypothetical protein [Gemmobacter tilapiae]GHC54297.1 hypothetical protein GCM10007315_16460 [Gemmobacter tilapiae]
MRASLLPQASLVGLLMMAGTALANPLTDDLVAQLRGQGFQKVTITRTLLGRVLILGSAAEGQREIVLNPNTGEILRDYFRPRSDMVVSPANGGDTLLVRGDHGLDQQSGNGGDQTATGPTDRPDGSSDETATGPVDDPSGRGGGGGKTPAEQGKGGKGGKNAGNNGKSKEK